ncbi:MAG: peptide chain release factor N(5)-glutamine methyltransferase [Desulfobacteraceae bacterium]|nr:peptide chain release factor N(5)-glutamine methyltransferase [Desulfobacteraceae bacterium]
MSSSKNEISSDIWTISKILGWTESYFKSKNIESPRLGAELLLCSVLNCSRISLYTNFDKPLLKNELEIFKSFIRRRVDFEPVSYITNEKSFFDLDFYVDSNVLIPRPDTEKLVEVVIDLFSDRKQDKLKILELGTGSGIISVSLADYFRNSFITAVDISLDALKTAKLNSVKNNVSSNIFFVNSSWFSGIRDLNSFDLIVSNPPYIKTLDIDQLQPEVRLYEPVLALDGGEDGLLCIDEIIGKSDKFLKKDGFLILEAGFDQKEGIKKITEKNRNLSFVDMVRDYGQRDRVAVIKRV